MKTEHDPACAGVVSFSRSWSDQFVDRNTQVYAACICRSSSLRQALGYLVDSSFFDRFSDVTSCVGNLETMLAGWGPHHRHETLLILCLDGSSELARQ